MKKWTCIGLLVANHAEGLSNVILSGPIIDGEPFDIVEKKAYDQLTEDNVQLKEIIKKFTKVLDRQMGSDVSIKEFKDVFVEIRKYENSGENEG